MADSLLPAIVSALSGLVGAAVGLYGGYLAHARTERSTRAAVNTAILAEAQRLKQVILAHHGWWEKVRTRADAARLPLYRFESKVFDKNIKYLGLLEASKAAKTLGFFGYMAWVNELQASRKQFVEAQLEKDFVDTYTTAIGNLAKLAADI